MCMCVYVCVTETETERQRETETERQAERVRKICFLPLYLHEHGEVHLFCCCLTAISSLILEPASSSIQHNLKTLGVI